MGILDAEIFGQEGTLSPRGLGVGLLWVFRSSEATVKGNWTNAFGIGVAYMHDSRRRILRDDFAFGEIAPLNPNYPRAGEKYLEPQFTEVNGDSVLLVLTWAFRKKPQPDRPDS